MTSTTNGDISAEANPYANHPDFLKLKTHEFKDDVAAKLTALFESGMLRYEDLEERTLESLGSLPPEHGAEILKQFSTANLIGVQNKAAFLGTCVKTFRERMRQMGATSALSTPLIQVPDKAKLEAILKRTGYNIDVTIGQRKYGGPPPGGPEDHPHAGCEVYVGRLPNDIYEDELIPLFEEVGKLWDLRLMMNPLTSQNKGYAFVTYTNKEDAQAAQEKFENFEIKPGRKLKVNVSVANTRVFVGNIPKNHSQEEIQEEFSQMTDGLEDVIVYSTPDDVEKKRNRGFAFLQYSDHKSASAAKNKLSNGKLKPFGREVMVDWAESMDEPDTETMGKVKILYVKNLKSTITEEDVRKAFEKFGEVERVKRQKDYAFVHFMERDECIKAMEDMQGHEFSGVKCEICLAKPQMDKTKKQQVKRERERRQGIVFRGMDFGGVPSRGGRGRSRGMGVPAAFRGQYFATPFDGYGFGAIDYSAYGAGPGQEYAMAAQQYYPEWYTGGAGAGGDVWSEDWYGFGGYGSYQGMRGGRRNGGNPGIAYGRGRGYGYGGRGGIRGSEWSSHPIAQQPLQSGDYNKKLAYYM